MSLDVYLNLPDTIGEAGAGIFVRENGSNREISRAEWDEKFPGREPIVVERESEYKEPLYEANITHNLASMAVRPVYTHPCGVLTKLALLTHANSSNHCARDSKSYVPTPTILSNLTHRTDGETTRRLFPSLRDTCGHVRLIPMPKFRYRRRSK